MSEARKRAWESHAGGSQICECGHTLVEHFGGSLFCYGDDCTCRSFDWDGEPVVPGAAVTRMGPWRDAT